MERMGSNYVCAPGTASVRVVPGRRQPNVHHQVGSQALQALAEWCHIDVLGDDHADFGVEHGVGGVGGQLAVRGQLLDVDPLPREDGRDLVDQAGAVEPDQFNLMA